MIDIWNLRLSEIAEEMGAVLRRAALSPNIRERRDYSAAIFDADGHLLAQAAHIPVHLGSMGMALRHVMAVAGVDRRGTPGGVPELVDDRVWILNDPFAGGTHLPDVTLVARAGEAGWVAVRAHHADVGGLTPGSMPVAASAADDDVLPRRTPLPPASGPRYADGAAVTGVAYQARTIDDEGLCLSPRVLDDVTRAAMIAASRAPAERRGDLLAQEAAVARGRDRLRALAAELGGLGEVSLALRTWAERLMRARLAALPDGVYAFADSLDDDGAGALNPAITARVIIHGDEADIDLADCAPQSGGTVNAVAAVTWAAVSYAFRLLLPEDAPTNEGLWAPLALTLRPGTLVCAESPAAVSAGNVETSQRIVDVVLGALAQALPGQIPAASAGSMSNVLIGGDDWAYYETIAGGAGATATEDGADALQTHMTNTRNTPVEELERAYPLYVTRYAIRRGSGGAGARHGGDGVVRQLALRRAATLTLVADRRRRAPYGLGGGAPGLAGEDTLARDGDEALLPSKITLRLRPGDRLTVSTPGGGGFGLPPKH